MAKFPVKVIPEEKLSLNSAIGSNLEESNIFKPFYASEMVSNILL